MPSNPNTAASRAPTLARAIAMVLGAALICWRNASARWPWALLAVAVALLLLAVLLPSAFRPIDRALKALQIGTVQLFSWGILLVVFVLIFTPGRWVLRSRLQPFWRRQKLNTYWVDGPLPTDGQDFQRQY